MKWPEHGFDCFIYILPGPAGWKCGQRDSQFSQEKAKQDLNKLWKEKEKIAELDMIV